MSGDEARRGEVTAPPSTERADASGAAERTNAGGTAKHEPAEDEQLARKLARIKHKILVLSGKGGVGKSFVAAGLAVDLARRGRRVGVLDIDIHGPSIPGLLGVEGERVVASENSIQPVASAAGVHVMSIGLLLQGRDDAVIWRGPLKYGVIKQFLRDVEWGELDYLIVDSPPGTGDEPLSVAQLISEADGALIVTTPQAVSTNDVRRSIGFARQLKLPVLGVIENMSGFVCPDCGTRTDLFGAGGGETMAESLGVPFLGRIPIDHELVTACDAGSLELFLAGKTTGATAFIDVVERVIADVERGGDGADGGHLKEETSMRPDGARTDGDKKKACRIAVPVVSGKLSPHFGHCEQFVIFEPGDEPGAVKAVDVLEAPPHQPGLLPAWLSERGADVVIAGGMGNRAQELFSQAGIEVVIGAAGRDPKELAASFLDGTLVSGRNICDH